MKYDGEGYRMTDCCGASATNIGGDTVCETCYEKVGPGQGDETERRGAGGGTLAEWDAIIRPDATTFNKPAAPPAEPSYPQIRDLMGGKNANIVANPIVAAAREVADRHGLKLHAEATGRTAGKITFTMTLSVPGQENAPQPPPEDFRRSAIMLGVDPTLYGRKFRGNRGTVYTITGISIRRHKYPFSGKGPQGGAYKFTKDQVLDGLIEPKG